MSSIVFSTASMHVRQGTAVSNNSNQDETYSTH